MHRIKVIQDSVCRPPHAVTQWTHIDDSPLTLVRELQDLYWLGVVRDLQDIIYTLQVWEQQDYKDVIPSGPKLEAREWTGFEDFVRRATREDSPAISEDILHGIEKINCHRGYAPLERTAKLLLQGASFLDIDKVIEYRPPLEDIGIWLRPRAAQLETATSHDEQIIPSFQAQICVNCSGPIRGARFHCIRGCFVTITPPKDDSLVAEPIQRPIILCETCTRSQAHQPNHMEKKHKDCILNSPILADQGDRICSCQTLQRRGQPSEQMYPFRAKVRRLHKHNCGLLQLSTRHCQAKYEELIRLKKLRQASQKCHGKAKQNATAIFLHSRQVLMGAPSKFGPPKKWSGRIIPRTRFKSLSAPTNDTILEDLPEETASVSSGKPSFSKNPITGAKNRLKRILFRPLAQVGANDIPYGNVHMALMFGTLLIENGVRDSKRGALITVRDQLQYLPVRPVSCQVETNLALSEKRELFKATQTTRPRRIKAIMKQVVGGAFCGFRNEELEHEIITELAAESKKCQYEPMKSRAFNQRKIRLSTQRILPKLKVLIQDQLRIYTEAIVNRLFNPEVLLTWHPLLNHCQKFCESIIDRRMFGSFLTDETRCQRHGVNQPLYLASFVCRYGNHDGFPRKVRPQTKHAAPNGLTEEYLIRYRRYGHHNDSDIFDTLMEYWTDWGAFSRPIFPHQDLFPWDCTEAYRKGSEDKMKCGDCNIVKHLWAFPFDSWSLIELHLFRERRYYTPNTDGIPVLSDIEWAGNRLRILEALQALNNVAVAMAKSSDFRNKCKWVFKIAHIDFPHVERFHPSRRQNAKLKGKSKSINSRGQSRVIAKPLPPKSEKTGYTDRVKLAGIHRAQPWSHLFEHGKFHDCTLAPWADLVRQDQVKAYIKLRDWRADELEEIPQAQPAKRPRPEFRLREAPGCEDRRQDQGIDWRDFNLARDDNSDDTSAVQADCTDGDSSYSSGDSDLSYDMDQPALFDDFGIDDPGSDSDGNYVDGIDDVDDGMSNPGDDCVDYGDSSGDCDCLVYNDDPPSQDDTQPDLSSQDRDGEDTDTNSRAERITDTTVGVGVGILGGMELADIVEDSFDGEDYPSDVGAYDDTDGAYTPEDSSYTFDTGGDIDTEMSPDIDDPSLYDSLDQGIDPGYSVDDSSWFDPLDSDLSGFDTYTDFGGGLDGLDDGGWFDNGGWSDNGGWFDNGGWSDNGGWFDNGGWSDNGGWFDNGGGSGSYDGGGDWNNSGW